jgi:hypothetical protein
MAIAAAHPRPAVHPWPMDTNPDPEVRERPTRRRFSAAYKLAILGFTIRGRKIVEIDVLADLARLQKLDLTVLDG